MTEPRSQGLGLKRGGGEKKGNNAIQLFASQKRGSKAKAAAAFTRIPRDMKWTERGGRK